MHAHRHDSGGHDQEHSLAQVQSAWHIVAACLDSSSDLERGANRPPECLVDRTRPPCWGPDTATGSTRPCGRRPASQDTTCLQAPVGADRPPLPGEATLAGWTGHSCWVDQTWPPAAHACTGAVPASQDTTCLQVPVRADTMPASSTALAGHDTWLPAPGTGRPIRQTT